MVGCGFAKRTPWNTVSLISSVTKRVESPLSPSLFAEEREEERKVKKYKSMSLLIISSNLTMPLNKQWIVVYL